MPRIPLPPSLESKPHKIGDKDPKIVACRLSNDAWRRYPSDDTNDEIRSKIREPLFWAN
jgi:hypothetical protein